MSTALGKWAARFSTKHSSGTAGLNTKKERFIQMSVYRLSEIPNEEIIGTDESKTAQYVRSRPCGR